MGTDITVIIETKNHSEWFHWATIEPSRNYAVFTALAGVRSTTGIETPFPARGFPDDACTSTRAIYEEEGGHTPSWLMQAEMSNAIFQLDDNYIGDFEAINLCMIALEQEKESTRIVFWFDS